MSEAPRKPKRKGKKKRLDAAQEGPSRLALAAYALTPVTLVALTAYFWSPRSVQNEQVERGNGQYQRRDYRGALGAYESAPGNGAPYAGVQLNRGLARYRVAMDGGFVLLGPDAAAPEGVSSAQEEFRTAARGGSGGAPEDVEPGLRARAEYDLGNTYLSERQWDNAITAYKEALRLAPGWNDAAWNLELARRLKEQDQTPPDAGPDATPDAPEDAPQDAAQDGPRDASDAAQDAPNDSGDSGPNDGASDSGGNDGGRDGGGDGGGGDSGARPDGSSGDAGAGQEAGAPDATPPRSMAPLDELDRSSRSLQNELLRRRGVSPVTPDDDR